MKLFGNKNNFAIEYEFLPDPDNGKAALEEEKNSWGNFSIWVKGMNLCQYSYKEKIIQYSSWYLYHLLLWLAKNASPILYEERPPVPTDKSCARAIFFDSAKRAFGLMSEEEDSAWYLWGQRHSLRACSNGAIYPDLFIRASGESVEFSWGNAHIPGSPEELFFTAPYGTEKVNRHTTRAVLYAFLEDASSELLARMPYSPKIVELKKIIDDNMVYNVKSQLRWFLPKIEWLFQKLNPFVDSSTEEYIPAPLLMYGSCSPTITESDVDTVLAALRPDIDSDMSSFINSTPIPAREQFQSGYDLASDFSDAFSESYGIDATPEHVIEKFGIAVYEKSFSDSSMRGIALAGKNFAPTIFVNTNNVKNIKENGKRFTVAHELCHLLFDREYGQEVGITSGPWAPVGVERRANAFAAMLLMPLDIIDEHITEYGDAITIDVCRDKAALLKVSVSSLIDHLCNLGKIDIQIRDRLRDEK